MAVSKENILETIANMTVLEVVDLIKAMEDKFGVSAAAPVAVAAVGALALLARWLPGLTEPDNQVL